MRKLGAVLAGQITGGFAGGTGRTKGFRVTLAETELASTRMRPTDEANPLWADKLPVPVMALATSRIAPPLVYQVPPLAWMTPERLILFGAAIRLHRTAVPSLHHRYDYRRDHR